MMRKVAFDEKGVHNDEKGGRHREVDMRLLLLPTLTHPPLVNEHKTLKIKTQLCF